MKKILSLLLAVIAAVSIFLIPVNAEEKAVTDIWVIKMPDKTEYFVNEEIDLTGLEIGVAYADGTYAVVTEGIECDTTVFSQKGVKLVTISYCGEPEQFQVHVDYNTRQKIWSIVAFLFSFFRISAKNIIAWF